MAAIFVQSLNFICNQNKNMSANKISKVNVATVQDMEIAIAQYALQGFVMVSKTATGATLQKAKKFNIAIGIVGFLLCFVGLIVYAIIYAAEADNVVVQIAVA